MIGLGTRKRGRRKAPKRPPGKAKAKPARAKADAPKTKRRDGWRAHGPDALGLAVLFLAVLMALSLAGSAGPVGEGIRLSLRGGFGYIAYLVPMAALTVAVAAFIRREDTGRILVGATLITCSLAGLVHLATGTAPLTGGYPGLAEGGGGLGASVAVPLRASIGLWAATLACIFAGLLGVLILTKTPLRRAVVAVWTWVTSGFRAGPTVDAPKRPVAVPTEAEEPEWDNEEIPDPAETTEIPVVAEPESEQVARVVLPRAPVTPPEPADPKQTTLDLDLPEPGDYQLPPLSLFERGTGAKRVGRASEDVARVLERTLQDFGVDATVAAITQGPTVTQFEVELGVGVKVSRVRQLGDDIAYALGSQDVRIIAPIPGKSAIGVEVPNRDRESVLVGDVMHSSAWEQHKHPLTCALGNDISGQPVVVNLAEMPHLLIAGATGAGKSSCLNALIASLLTRARPSEVRLVLIDPKMVELSHFADLPHLLSPVVTHPKRAAETLTWVVREMERRYELLSGVGQRNIDFYNSAVRSGAIGPGEDEPHEPLPYIAVFVDELADLMMVAPRQVEDAICRIAQMARAVGIHLVVATQRPSVDVVTGLIKANIPSRVALSVASQVDSRTIIDMAGAEKLVGHGDMLYLPTGTSKPRRVQGAFVSETELSSLTTFIRDQAPVVYEEDALEAATSESAEGDDDDDDDLYEDALRLVVSSQMGSTSMLQRKLRVGFARAGRLMDLLERRGVVGPQEGSKARAVLITPEQLDSRASA